MSKVNCEGNFIVINLLIDGGTRVNIIDIETLQKISKVCKIGLETTNSKINKFHWDSPLKLKGKLNTKIKNSVFEAYAWFYAINKLKTGNLLSKNTAEILQILQRRWEKI